MHSAMMDFLGSISSVGQWSVVTCQTSSKLHLAPAMRDLDAHCFPAVRIIKSYGSAYCGGKVSI